MCMLRTRRHHVVDARAHSQIPGHNQYGIVHLRASELSRVLTPRQSILDEGAPHTRTPRTIAATVQCAKSSNVTRERMNMYARVETSERNCGVNRSVPQHIFTMFFLCVCLCVVFTQCTQTHLSHVVRACWPANQTKPRIVRALLLPTTIRPHS